MISESDKRKLERAMAAADIELADIARGLETAESTRVDANSAAGLRARQEIAEYRAQVAIEKASMAKFSTIADAAMRLGHHAESSAAVDAFNAAAQRAELAQQTLFELEELYARLTGESAS